MRGGRRRVTDGAQVANDALKLSGWPAREAGVRMCVEQQTQTGVRMCVEQQTQTGVRMWVEQQTQTGVRMCVEQQTQGLHGDDGVVGLLGDTKVFAARGV